LLRYEVLHTVLDTIEGRTFRFNKKDRQLTKYRLHANNPDGKTLPLDLDSGSYEVRDLTAAGIGRVFEGKVIYDKTYGHAAYGCGGQCCYNSPYLTNNPLGIPFQGTAGNGVNTSDNCGGPPVNVSSTFWGNWRTAIQSIATVNTTGTHTGMAAGSTTSSTSGQIQQTYGRYQCTVQTRTPSGGDHVQIPSSLKVLSISTLPTGTSGDYGCLTGSDYGIKLDIKYQVLDQNTPALPLKDATMVPHEHVIYPATGQTVDTDICPSRISTCTHTTDVNGIFHDAPYGACSAGSFSLGLTQTIKIIFNGVNYTVRTNSVTISSSSSGHGSLSNGSDISKTR
jgi:hypothetical protein